MLDLILGAGCGQEGFNGTRLPACSRIGEGEDQTDFRVLHSFIQALGNWRLNHYVAD